MTIPPGPSFPASADSSFTNDPWHNVARLCRRVCLLREQGDGAAAERLQANELAAAVADVQARTGLDEGAGQRQLGTILATEQERVANAAVLAELLAPMLRSAPAPLGATLPAARNQRAADEVTPVPAPRPAGGNIADFIDEMLAQDRAASGDARGRRAS